MNRKTLHTQSQMVARYVGALFLISRWILCTFSPFPFPSLVCVHPIHNLAHCYLYYILCVCARYSIFIVECHCLHLFSRSIIGWFYNDIFYTLVMYAILLCALCPVCLVLPCLVSYTFCPHHLFVFLSVNSIEMIYCCV